MNFYNIDIKSNIHLAMDQKDNGIDEIKTCSICDGDYPESKHDFKECFSLDVDWDLAQMTNKKKDFGQFYTTKYKHILQGMTLPTDIKIIIEPFAGNGDLLKFAPDIKTESFDIDPKKKWIIKRDTLLYPVNYTDKYVLTNPPYLARNKNTDKTLYDKYGENDLFKCFIRTLINNPPIGGIIIIPLNFWSSTRKTDIKLRRDFLNIFKIVLINIFEERVFDDTSYTICSIQFTKQIKPTLDHILNIVMYPRKKTTTITLNNANNNTIGGDIYNLEMSNYDISRLTRCNKTNQGITNILVKCIDNNERSRICLAYSEKRYVDDSKKLSARSYATLVITPVIDTTNQLIIIKNFNDLLNKYRDKYESLFLSNYRESNSIARKRISFDLVYRLVSHLLKDINHG